MMLLCLEPALHGLVHGAADGGLLREDQYFTHV